MKLIREICFFTFFSFCAAIADDLSGRHLGALFSMTGFGALEGEADYNGMLLALEEDLQFQEKKLSLTLEDFQSDMAKTATSMNRLLGNKEIKVIVGPNWAEFLAVAAPIAQKKRIPLLSPTGYAKETFAANSCALIFFPPPRSWVKPLTKKLAGKKVVTITTTNQYFEQLETSIGEEVTIVEKIV